MHFVSQILSFLILALFLSGCDDRSSSSERTRLNNSEIERLQSLGYLGGYRPAPTEQAGTKDPSTKASPGFTLVTSGHAPVAYLLDRDGKVRHTWSLEFDRIFPEHQISKRNRKRDLAGFWRHATLLEGGDLLAIFEGLALVRLNRDSKVLWAKLNGAHHDLELLEDGTIVVLTRQVETRDERAVLVDYISYLNSSGEEIKKVSIVDAVLNSPFKKLVLRNKKIASDLLHTNSLQVLDAKAASGIGGAQAGDILLSMRNANSLAIVNPSSGRLVWAFRDIFKRQHYARVYPEHNELLLFDNRGASGYARVLRYNWPAMKLIEEVKIPTSEQPFVSNTLGLAQRLENGDLLIVESEGGKLIEINPKSELIWRYLNPHRTGQDNRLIATIPHASRVTGRFINWLNKK